MKILLLTVVLACSPPQQTDLNALVQAVLREVAYRGVQEDRPIFLDLEQTAAAFRGTVEGTPSVQLSSISIPQRSVRDGARDEVVECTPTERGPWADCSVRDGGVSVTVGEASRNPAADEVTATVAVAWAAESGLLVGYTQEMILGRVNREWQVVRTGETIVR